MADAAAVRWVVDAVMAEAVGTARRAATEAWAVEVAARKAVD